MSKGKKTHMVVTNFSLKKAVNAKGIAYSQALFTVGRDLSADEQTTILAISAQMKAISSSVGFDADVVLHMEDSAPTVDHETGEIIKPL